MKTLYISGIIFLLILLSSCEKLAFDKTHGFAVKNNTNELIYFKVSKTYPDTLIPSEVIYLYPVDPQLITYYYSRENWEDFFASLPADTLSIFIFDKDINSYDWEDVQNNYRILRRIEVSLQDINDSKTVPYP